jgi:elongator complex protein 2
MAAVQTLYVHESTVACLRFSSGDEVLASSGKDRTLCAYSLDKSTGLFKAVAATRNAHKRIVWDCAWSDEHVLLTASRDGTCKLWSINRNCEDVYSGFSCICSYTPFNEVAVTSVDATRIAQGRILVAMGSECGDILIAEMTRAGGGECETAVSSAGIVPLLLVDDRFAHGSSVKRARWSRGAVGGREGEALLATCGTDATVRVFKIELKIDF